MSTCLSTVDHRQHCQQPGPSARFPPCWPHPVPSAPEPGLFSALSCNMTAALNTTCVMQQGSATHCVNWTMHKQNINHELVSSGAATTKRSSCLS